MFCEKVNSFAFYLARRLVSFDYLYFIYYVFWSFLGQKIEINGKFTLSNYSIFRKYLLASFKVKKNHVFKEEN